MAAHKTMKAVVYDGPYKVSLVDRPVPSLQDEQDIIVKVQATALCGSELHVFRGHQPSGTGFIMGHEFTGVVVEAGKSVQTVKVGDKIVSPFTVSCMECFYCEKGCSSRCTKGKLFGCQALDGGQAEYVRVPLADGTVVRTTSSIPDTALVLMADIWPTGLFGVLNALKHVGAEEFSRSTVVVIGCGPVGLCSIVSALHFRPRHLFAVDSVESRLKTASDLGAEPLDFKADGEGMVQRILDATSGRGADIVVEVVGLSPALRTAFDLIRPWGFISSIGVHNGEIPWTGSEAYGKNLRVHMGRCPVRSIFAEALELLEKKYHLLSFMFDEILPLADAVRGYELFDQMKAQKVIFMP